MDKLIKHEGLVQSFVQIRITFSLATAGGIIHVDDFGFNHRVRRSEVTLIKYDMN
jgi:hypothetical protein